MASDFAVSENGTRQKVAYFGAEDQPISLAILVDSSGSMNANRKVERALALLSPLIRGNLPEDEIFLAPFTDRIGPFVSLTRDERLHPPLIRESSAHGGTALYDALATALCHLRKARNMKQAVVVVTDGSDQNSRLSIEQLIELTQASQAQIFMVGFWGQEESEYNRHSGDTVTLVSGHEIDNPLHVFARIANKSGAESFFPSSEHELKQVLVQILGILRAEYTLAYYSENFDKLRRVDVKLRRGGVVVRARREAGSQASGKQAVHFDASSCNVSSLDHPYPWEHLLTHHASGTITYQENFSDPRTGWPNHFGSRYASGAYEMYRKLPAASTDQQLNWVDVGTIAAYGPWWTDFRASIFVNDLGSDQQGEGMLFRLNDRGYYALLLTRIATKHCSFKLVKKKNWSTSLYLPLISHQERTIIPWTGCTEAEYNRHATQEKVTVECRGDQITVSLNDVQKAPVKDDSFSEGYVGMAQFGYGRTQFRNLKVESLR